MKGPDDEEDDADELGSTQGSLQPPGPEQPGSPPARAQQAQHAEGNERSVSPEALAEDERNAEGAVGLQDDAQVPSQATLPACTTTLLSMHVPACIAHPAEQVSQWQVSG
jgi:hypothetical protein